MRRGERTSGEGTEGMCHFLGHSHLDAAWLWSFGETRRIFGEGCESVLRLMDRLPFTFCQSSAQYYKWLEEEHPEAFERVRRKVKEGRWEIVGGTWVEPDGNMPSGESLVRQFLYGKRYFMEKFGVDVKVAWFPDSFGYAWTLPQIMRKAGMEYFLTQKMLWNDTTAFPYYFFRWTAADGSSILAHEMVGAYDEKVAEPRVLEQLKQLKARHRIDDLLMLFGEGDHGGGVSEEMVRRALEFVEGKKPVKGAFTTSAEYLKAATERLGREAMPEVDDELYFQFHRGTYTTQARTKRNNRKAECMLEAAEKFATVAYLLGRPYPSAALSEAWQKLLLNQFHDVLPGSSIPEVYRDSQEDFDSVFRTAERVISASLAGVAGEVDTSGAGKSVLVFNPLSWSRSGVVEIPAGDAEGLAIVDALGRRVPSQEVDGGMVIFLAEDVPSIGYREYRAAPARDKPRRTSLKCAETKGEIRLENRFLVVRVDRGTGLVRSVFDKASRREVLQGPGGLIQVFEDAPVRGRACVNSRIDAAVFDAWEVFIYQQEGGVKSVDLDRPLEVEVVERGPVRARVRARYRYVQEGRPGSTFIQEVMLCDGSPIVEFRLEADWHAEHRLAKVAFPLTVHSDFTAYEIPYGSITRRNPLSPEATLEERAKYEAPGQKWVDHTADDGSFGVSLLNDCKYGFDAGNDVVRMTLLRSAGYPFRLRAGFGLPTITDPEGELTDQGKHSAAYALYPHRAGFREALTARKGYEFNCPMRVVIEPSHDGRLPKAHSFISVEPEGVVVTVAKKAEDSGAIVVRLVETSGKEAKARVRFPGLVESAVETDLMERRSAKVRVIGANAETKVSGNGIGTLLVRTRAPRPVIRDMAE
jgi:alpha-mannosidase